MYCTACMALRLPMVADHAGRGHSCYMKQNLAHMGSVDGQVEKLLVEADQARAGGARGAGGLERQCQLLERLAGEVARLHYNTARGQVSPHTPAGCRA